MVRLVRRVSKEYLGRGLTERAKKKKEKKTIVPKFEQKV